MSACYLVILPIDMDIAKFIPPFMSGPLGKVGNMDMNCIVLPPMPQEAPGLEWLEIIAEQRNDDLICGGTQRLDDVNHIMLVLHSMTESYKALCDSFFDPYHADTETEWADSTVSGISESALGNPNALSYANKSEEGLLQELTALLGAIRYAVQGSDSKGIEQATSNLRAIAELLPDNRKINTLVKLAVSQFPNADKLAALYLDRAYALFHENYLQVREIEEQISQLTPPNESLEG